MKVTIVLFLSVVILGCSNRDYYNIIHGTAKQRCNELPAPEQQDCRNRKSESYDEYERKRKSTTE